MQMHIGEDCKNGGDNDNDDTDDAKNAEFSLCALDVGPDTATADANESVSATFLFSLSLSLSLLCSAKYSFLSTHPTIHPF
jgi:hypothetical protein